MLSRVRHKSNTTTNEEPLANLATNIIAQHQLEALYMEPDFERETLSPRSISIGKGELRRGGKSVPDLKIEPEDTE